MLIGAWLAAVAAVCGLGFAAWFPGIATAVWMAVVASTPDLWRGGDHEALIAAVKGVGLVLVAVLGARFGWRRDAFNPAYAFGAMFCTGLLHGLYPGLTVMSSVRSLIGSAGPFAFGFARTGADFRLLVTRMAVAGPVVNLAVGVGLQLAHVHELFSTEDGSFRLGGAGLPAFLGGFALIAVYAGLLEILRREDTGESALLWYGMLAVNGMILLLTGARAPLALAGALIFGTLLVRRRLMALAGCGVVVAVVLLFAGQFSFIRAVSLVQGGQAESLSNRNLIWPDFEAAIRKSPWIGWGVGAGKAVVPANSGIATLIGTTAAHNEYLRIGSEGGALGMGLLVLCMGIWAYKGSRPLPRAERWFMRVVFVAFAVHSATDNTLIATTSSVLFIWASAVFSAASKPVEEVA